MECAMKKFLAIVIVATAIGAPAFAQSFDPENGTGNLVGGMIVAATPARIHSRAVPRYTGEEAYAMSTHKKLNPAHLHAQEAQSSTLRGQHHGRWQHGLQ
jgi:hypothetical protein